MSPEAIIQRTLTRNKDGTFIKGGHYNPKTEFQSGSSGPRKGIPKPGWTNRTSFRRDHLSWNRGKEMLGIRGSNHPNWKGDEVSYGALHEWVKRSLGKPEICEHCRSTEKRYYDWANKSGNYRRDLSDWIRLCKPCHKRFDILRIKEEELANAIISSFKSHLPVLIAGNGGSLSQAIHFANELSGKFKINRPPLPAIPLSDVGVITAIANDFGYEFVFSRQVEAFGKKGGLLICFTTSDSWISESHSKNIIRAVIKARELGIKSFVVGSQRTSNLQRRTKVIKCRGEDTPSVQEEHQALIHRVSDVIERRMFP